MKDTEHDWLIWEGDRGEEGEQHPEVQDPESSLDCFQVHRFWLGSLLVGADDLADSDEQEEDHGNDDVEGIEVLVKGEDAEVVEIPEEVEDDHEHDGTSSEDVKF